MQQHHNYHPQSKSCNTIQKRWISSTSSIATNNNSDTYYDSQSGQHVPIHNENEVSVYLRGIGDCSTQQVIGMTKQYGISGSILTLEQEQMNGNIVNDTPISRNDNIYLHIKPEICFDKHQNEMSFPKGYNPSFEYKVGNDDTMIRTIKQYKRDVSIGIFNSNIIMNEDPISVAANIANIIDCTKNENETSINPYISNILIAPVPPSIDKNNTATTDCNADDLVRLCEELSYLDVPGPTIKSRLIVSTLNNNEEVIEECLQIGINKYILDVSDDMNDLERRLKSLKDIVEEEGKELILIDE